MSREDAQFRLRLPHNLLAQVKADALASGRTINAEIVSILGERQTPLRDWFAGQAMAGLLAANATYGGKTDAREALASDAYQHADAMLAERAKGGAS